MSQFESIFNVANVSGSKCEATLLLRPGLIPPQDYEPIKYPAGALVYIDVKIFKAKVQTGPAFVEEDWEYFDDRVNWQGFYTEICDYTVGDLVMLNDRLYRKVRSSQTPIDCPVESPTIPIDNPNGPNWEYVDDIGPRFPPWATNTTAINVVIDCSQMVETHPSSGGRYWELDEEVMFGAEAVQVSDQHSIVQDLYRNQTEITQIYTIKMIHVVSREQKKTPLNPNPETEQYIGITLGVYMLPPGVFGEIMIDRLDLKDIYRGQESIASSYITYSSSNAVSHLKLSGRECTLLPKIHPVSGATFPAIYAQWRASDVPIIVQSDNIAHYIAVTQPVQYTACMRECSENAIKCNMVDLSDTAFKYDYCKRSKTAQIFDPKYTLNVHDAWIKERYAEKSKYFQSAGEKWKEGNARWLKQHTRARERVTEFYKKLDQLVVKKVSTDVWLSSKDSGYSKCRIGKQRATDVKRLIDELKLYTSIINSPLQSLICGEVIRITRQLDSILG